MRHIPGYGTDFSVTQDGRIWSHKTNTFRKLSVGTEGYLWTPIRVDGVLKRLTVHRAVAIAYIPNPLGKLEVNHIDADKYNNCAENLEWCTRQENIDHSVKNGLNKKRGKDKKKRKSRTTR